MTDGPSFCWQCHGDLVPDKVGFIFAVVLDPDNHVLRVHKNCQEYAVGFGYRLPENDHAAQRYH